MATLTEANFPMPPITAVSGALTALAFAILTPNLASATGIPTDKAIPIDLGDDTDVLTARASIPAAAGGPVADACRAAARASNGGNTGTIVADRKSVVSGKSG